MSQGGALALPQVQQPGMLYDHVPAQLQVQEVDMPVLMLL